VENEEADCGEKGQQARDALHQALALDGRTVGRSFIAARKSQ
jgi:hypothetical protein